MAEWEEEIHSYCGNGVISGMFFVDTHFHNGDYIEDMVSYCAEAEKAGVRRLLLCASGYEDSVNASLAAEKNECVYFAAGIHPHEAASERANLALFGSFENHPKLAAVGEAGLDYYYGFSGNDVQKEVFSACLELALRWNLPAVVHCRDKEGSIQAYGDAFALLEPFARKGGRFVLHCYAGDLDFARRFLELGAFFGIGGMITFTRADNIRSIVSALPLSHLLLETDAPYLAPKPHRGKNNSSTYIPLVAQKLAEVKGISLEECALATTSNALGLFSRIKEA